MLDWEILKCPQCDEEGDFADFETCGACEGNAFCPACHCEIELDTKLPALLCGKCGPCREMMIEGSFAKVQEMRKRKRAKASLNNDGQ